MTGFGIAGKVVIFIYLFIFQFVNRIPVSEQKTQSTVFERAISIPVPRAVFLVKGACSVSPLFLIPLIQIRNIIDA